LTALSSTRAGTAPPVFQENGPFAVVTFRVRVGETAQVATPRTSGDGWVCTGVLTVATVGRFSVVSLE
jgi:hypothetical protein